MAHRNLMFNSLDDALTELEGIERFRNIETTGVWSFYQILTHLADYIESSMNNFSWMQPLSMRRTIGRANFAKLKQADRMDPGLANPSAPKVREEGDEKVALQRLRRMIEEYKKFTGEHPEHPFYGILTREDWDFLHRIHLAHHLGYVREGRAKPKAAKAKKVKVKKVKVKKVKVKKVKVKKVKARKTVKARAANKSRSSSKKTRASARKKSGKKSPRKTRPKPRKAAKAVRKTFAKKTSGKKKKRK